MLVTLFQPPSASVDVHSYVQQQDFDLATCDAYKREMCCE